MNLEKCNCPDSAVFKIKYNLVIYNNAFRETTSKFYNVLASNSIQRPCPLTGTIKSGEPYCWKRFVLTWHFHFIFSHWILFAFHMFFCWCLQLFVGVGRWFVFKFISVFMWLRFLQTLALSPLAAWSFMTFVMPSFFHTGIHVFTVSWQSTSIFWELSGLLHRSFHSKRDKQRGWRAGLHNTCTEGMITMRHSVNNVPWIILKNASGQI